MKRFILSLLVVLSFGLITETMAQNVARIGSTYYTTLADALDAVHQRDTIHVLTAVSLTSPLEITKDFITIVGDNSASITANDCAAIYIKANLTEFTVKNLQLMGASVTNPYLAEESMNKPFMGIGTYNQDYDVQNLVLDNVSIYSFDYGLYFSATAGSDNVLSIDADNLTVRDCYIKGMYVEKLNQSSFKQCNFANNGTTPDKVSPTFQNWMAGVDVNLKYGDYINVNFIDCEFNNNGANNGTALLLKARNDGTTYGANPATLTNVTVQNCTFGTNNNLPSGYASDTYIILGEPGKGNPTPLQVHINNSTVTGGTPVNVRDERGFQGAGTATDPYLIPDKEALIRLANLVNAGSTFNGKYFLQTSDIDLDNMEWTPIGGTAAEMSAANPFGGHYDGDNHTISNLKITAERNNNALFGATNGSATIQNLKIYNAEVHGSIATAVISGYSATTPLYKNVHVYGYVNVYGEKYVGGIVGFQDYAGSIDSCSFEGTIQCSDNQAGGIIGTGYQLQITNCYANANVSVRDGGAGAIIGRVMTNCIKIEHCTATGSITDGKPNGGICGQIIHPTSCVIKDNYSMTLSENPIIGNDRNGEITEAEAVTAFQNNGWRMSVFNTDTYDVRHADGSVITTLRRANNLIFDANDFPYLRSGKVTFAYTSTLTQQEVIDYVNTQPNMQYRLNDGELYITYAVARVNNTYYEDLQEAINNAHNGETVELVANIDYGTPLTSNTTASAPGYILHVATNQDITIDLNGKVVKAQADGYQNSFILQNDGTLTIIDGNLSAANDYAVTPGGAFELTSTVLEDLTYSTPTATIRNYGILNVNSGRVVAYHASVNGIYNPTYGIVAPNGELNVNGGYIEGYDAGIYLKVDDNMTSTVNIHNGTVYGKDCSLVTKIYGNANLNIDGGVIRNEGTNAAIFCLDGNAPYKQTVTISGGVINGGIINYWANSTFNITGGQISGSRPIYDRPERGYTSGVVSTWNITGGTLTTTNDTYAVWVDVYNPSKITIDDTTVVNGLIYAAIPLSDGNWGEDRENIILPVGGFYKNNPQDYVATGYTTRILGGTGIYKDYYIVVPENSVTISAQSNGAAIAADNNGIFNIYNLTNSVTPTVVATDVNNYTGAFIENTTIRVEAKKVVFAAPTAYNLTGWNDDNNNTTLSRDFVITSTTEEITAIYSELSAQPLENLSVTLKYGDCDTLVPETWSEFARVAGDVVVNNLRTDITPVAQLAYIVEGSARYPYGADSHSRVAAEQTRTLVWNVYDAADMTYLCQATSELSVVYPPCGGTYTATDCDGNTYSTVRVGCDCWFAENLKSTHYSNAACDGAEIAVAKDYGDVDANGNTFGLLYSWYSAAGIPEGSTDLPTFDGGFLQGACPMGWYLPTTEDYVRMYAAVNSAVVLKSTNEADGRYWLGNPGNNASGFNALPAGYYDSSIDRFYNLYGETYFWSYTYNGIIVNTSCPFLTHTCPDMPFTNMEQGNGVSIRCVRKEPAGAPAPTPTPSFTCGTSTVQDYDGNTYNTVQIGTQCWMKENMKTTHFSDGTPIALESSDYSHTVAYCYAPDDDMSNVSDYGYLYNWFATMHGAAASDNVPSGVQGVCPTGWHVPSSAEWTELTDYVSSQSAFLCNGNNTYIAKALAADYGWDSSSATCAVGNDESLNNATGFSAVPAGYFTGSYFSYFGTRALFWNTSAGSDGKIADRNIGASSAVVASWASNDSYGRSVRCLRD